MADEPTEHEHETAGDGLDPEAVEGLDAIEAEGAADERDERAQELEESGKRDHPFDRELAGALEILNHGVFAIAAGRRGPHWALTDQEAQELAKCQAQCIERYIGSVAMGPAVSLVFTSAAIVGPRMSHDVKLAREHAARNAQGEEGGDRGAD